MAQHDPSLGEEIANAITHGAGLLASLIALPVLIWSAAQSHDGARVTGATIFGITLVSALHSEHALSLVSAGAHEARVSGAGSWSDLSADCGHVHAVRAGSASGAMGMVASGGVVGVGGGGRTNEGNRGISLREAVHRHLCRHGVDGDRRDPAAHAARGAGGADLANRGRAVLHGRAWCSTRRTGGYGTATPSGICSWRPGACVISLQCWAMRPESGDWIGDAEHRENLPESAIRRRNMPCDSGLGSDAKCISRNSISR